jgi:hypothetical protein
MRVDVRSKDHCGDLVIATALALWSAVGRPSGRIEVGTLENWYEPGIETLAPTTNPRSAAFLSALPPLDALAVAEQIND